MGDYFQQHGSAPKHEDVANKACGHLHFSYLPGLRRRNRGLEQTELPRPFALLSNKDE
jgi:hypothetical protein